MGGDVMGMEEGLIWLPSHVLQEALFHSPNTDLQLHQPIKKHQQQFHHHRCPTASPPDNLPLNWRKSRSRVHQKQKHQSNNGDGRMQAFFLASGPTTSGTGVFLPTTASLNPNHKPACSPVLLPSRVVQALNLNVHSLGLQLSPRPDGENGWRKKNKMEGRSRKSGDVNPTTTSPEMLLPKEWTY